MRRLSALCLLLVFQSFSGFGQQSEFRYAYGGQGSDIARTTTTFGRKFFYLFGSSTSNSTTKKVTLVKTDSLGRLLTIRDYAAGSSQEGFAILNKDSSLYWCGEVTNQGVSHIAFVKADLDGNPQWQRFFRRTGNGAFQPFSLTATADNGFAICGTMNATQFFLIKLDSAGAIQWVKVRNDFSQGYCVASARNGDLIVSGMLDQEILVSRMRLDGTVLWANYFGAGGLDVGKSIAELNDGTLLVNGYRYEGQRDFMLTKVSAAGNLIWSKKYDYRQDVNYGISLDTDGNPIVTGYTFLQGSSTSIDYSIFKVDTAGTVLWSKLLSGPFPDYVSISPRHLTPLGNNEYITAGVSQSADNGNAGDDFVLFRFKATTNLGCFDPNYPLTQSSQALPATGTAAPFSASPGFEVSTTLSLSMLQVGLCRKIACEVNSPVFDNLGPNRSIPCGDTTAQVLDAGNPGMQYLWSTGDTSRQIRVRRPGIYHVRVTGPCGVFLDSITISQPSTPKPQIRALGPTTFCQGDSVILTYEGNVQSPRWSNGDTQRLILVRAPGRYWLIAGSGGCPSPPSDTITITVLVPPVPDAGRDTILCQGQGARLGRNEQGLGLQYQWTPSTYLSDPFAANPVLTNPNPDTNLLLTYEVRKVVSPNGCEARDTVRVLLAGKGRENFAGPDLELCSGESATIGTPGVDIPEVFYVWTPARWLASDREAQTTITPILEEGTQPQRFVYTLRYSQFMVGCPASDSVVVTVHPRFEMRPDGFPRCTDSVMIIPNILTPDGNGRNDLFRITTLAYYPDNRLVIFNRWGKKVYEESPYRNGWQTQTPGIYFYRLELPAAGRVYKGWVEVAR